MSHFSVLVVGENIKDQLAPYQENNMEDCPKEFLKFNETDLKEYREKFEIENKKEFFAERIEIPENLFYRIVNSPIGRLIFYEVNRKDLKRHLFFKKGREYLLCLDNCNDQCYPAQYIRVENCNYDDKIEINFIKIAPPRDILLKDKYETFEDYLGSEGECIDKETGKYGYWENPDAEWDWYVVGGRWSNEVLETKDGFVNECLKDELINIKKGEDLNNKIFAIVKDGEWYSRGKMMMFATVDNEKPLQEWEGILNAVFKEIEGDELLTVIDCHI